MVRLWPCGGGDRCRRWQRSGGAYVSSILPVSGLLQVGGRESRYAYVAMLPLLLLAGGAAVWAWRHSTTVARVALTGLLGYELLVFGVRTRSLIPEWHSEETLRRAVLAWFPDSEYDNRALALVLVGQGRASEALEYAQRDVQVAPQQCYAHDTLGLVFSRLGRLPDAIAHFEQALQIELDYTEAHYNLGIALEQTGNAPEAIRHYEQAWRIKPDFTDVRNALARLQTGQ